MNGGPLLPRRAEDLVAALRGWAPDETLRTREDRTRSIQAGIEAVFREERIGCSGAEQVAAEAWPLVAGPEAARYSHPLRYEALNGRLYVAVSSAACRQELAFRRRALEARLRDWPGLANLREIVLRAG